MYADRLPLSRFAVGSLGVTSGSESDPPVGYRYGPPYRITPTLRVRGAVAVALARPRSLARDALEVLRHMPAPPLVRGSDRIPEDGGFVVVGNHYERPGLWMAWPALLISHVVRERTGSDVHWIAIQEWEGFALRGVPIPRAVTRAVFERAFRTYAIIAMPPSDAPAAARAGSMRSAAHHVKRGSILGLMPEGTVGPTPELLPARVGAGSFLLFLAGSGARLLPVGIFEDDGRLVTQFGEPFQLSVPPGVTKDARDTWARNQVMLEIRNLVPEALWGAYRT